MMDMSDPAVQDMLEEDKREALARIRGAIPTPNELTAQIAEAVEPFSCTADYEHTGGNCGAIGVYRRDAGGMMEPIGAYLLVGGSEGPWPHSSADEPLNVQWDGDPDPDWGDFEVFLYGDEIEARHVASVSGVAALVAAVVAWCKTETKR
jgi:hypothetical protein